MIGNFESILGVKLLVGVIVRALLRESFASFGRRSPGRNRGN